jgi:hypothetical protein
VCIDFILFFPGHTEKINGYQFFIRDAILRLTIITEALNLPTNLLFIFVADVEVQFD